MGWATRLLWAWERDLGEKPRASREPCQLLPPCAHTLLQQQPDELVPVKWALTLRSQKVDFSGGEGLPGRFPSLRGHGAHAYNPTHSRDEGRKTTGSRSAWIYAEKPCFLKKNHLKFSFLFNKELDFVVTYSCIYIMTFSSLFPLCSLPSPSFAAALPSNPPSAFMTHVSLSPLLLPSLPRRLLTFPFLLSCHSYVCANLFVCVRVCLFIYLFISYLKLSVLLLRTSGDSRLLTWMSVGRQNLVLLLSSGFSKSSNVSRISPSF